MGSSRLSVVHYFCSTSRWKPHCLMPSVRHLHWSSGTNHISKNLFDRQKGCKLIQGSFFQSKSNLKNNKSNPAAFCAAQTYFALSNSPRLHWKVCVECVFAGLYKSNLISESDRVPPQRGGGWMERVLHLVQMHEKKKKRKKKKWARSPHAFFTDACMIIPICSH